MAEATAVRRIILGTAGHIDHGKTSLVERLTGVRTDRLKEERERGMTIDVGYAAFELPDGTEVGLLDVPGHERLVRTMVAAATAMDLALLVVAADDGPMPQTREHVEVLDLLGVTQLVVALNKIDLVDEDTADIAEALVQDLLEPTGMKGAPIVRVSGATGEGIDALKEAILGALPAARSHEDDGRVFRMPVLRSFTAPGRGTVLTGIPISGALTEGERIEVLPEAWPGRVRGIQVHKRDASTARAGQRTALALSDVAADRVTRGMVVTAAKTVTPARRLAVRVRLLPQSRPIEHRDRVRLHLGSAQVVARVHVLGRGVLEPGADTIVDLEAFADIVAAPGDRLVLRTENASDTIGGGRVVQILERRLPRRRGGLVEHLLRTSEHLDDPRVLLLSHLRAAGDAGARSEEVVAATAFRPEVIREALEALVGEGQIVRFGHEGRTWVLKEVFDQAMARVEKGLAGLHAKDPALKSHSLAATRTAAGRTAAPLVDAALDALIADGRVVREGEDAVRIASHEAALDERDARGLAAVREALARGAGQPPGNEDLEAELGMQPREVKRLLGLLANRGEAVRAGDWFFDAAFIESAKQRLRAHVEAHGGFTPADARSLLDTTRKWVIPLLETLDKLGFSRRVGDRRVLR